MYTNIPLSVLLVRMKDLLDLVFDFQVRENGYKSIFLEYGFKDNSPFVKDENCAWDKQEPVEVEDEPEGTKYFYIGRDLSLIHISEPTRPY